MTGRLSRRFFVTAATVLVAASCSTKEDLAAAEREVEKFHQAYNAGRFDDIYEGTTDDFKKASAQQDFKAMLETVQRKLGTMNEDKRENWTVNFAPGGTTVKVIYVAAFAHGKGTETFDYRMSGKKAVLIGYNITSKNLLPS